MALDYNASKKLVLKTIIILGIITFGEVLFALLGKGYIISGFHIPHVIMGGVMIFLSAVKAYFIVYEFMHLKYEVPGLLKSVLLPTFLLVWAIIAFLYEGNDWGQRRKLISDKNQEERLSTPAETGLIYQIENKY